LARITHYKLFTKEKNHCKWAGGLLHRSPAHFHKSKKKNPMIKSATISFALTKMSGKKNTA
jgi:hypothetical protein